MTLKKILGLSFLVFTSFQGQATFLEENNNVILYGSHYPINTTEEINIKSDPARKFISIPDAIGGLIHLKTLIITLSLRGIIPESIGNLINLTELGLSYHQLTGAIPESIGNLTALQKLNLVHNELTGDIPKSIRNLTALQKLDLFHNQLTGSIPESISNLSDLTYLNLCSNQLTGGIPESISNLSNLTNLNLSGNPLTGSIPESIGNLSNLTYLDLSSNWLTGSIPESISNLSNLTNLNLCYNRLTGGIPESIGSLTKLRELNLVYNELTGDIPKSIGNLTALQKLNLASNQLTGMYPNLFTLPGVLRLEYNHLNLVPGSQTPICVRSAAVIIGVGGESFNPKLFNCFEQKIDEPVCFSLSDLQGTPVTALEGYVIWFKKEKDAEGNEKDIIEGKNDNIYKDLPKTNLPPALQEAVDFILSEKNFRGDTRKSSRNL